MTLQFTSWNADRLLRRKPRRILSDYGDVLGPQLQNEIASSQFDWPRFTQRKNGRRVAPGKRDIVDTGEFINSQQEPVISEGDDGVSMTIEWTASHAKDIFYGEEAEFVTRDGSIYTLELPGRDWIKPALEAQPFADYFRMRWKELEGSGGGA